MDLIIDIPSLIHRSFHAMKGKTPDDNTAAISTTVNMVLDCIDSYGPRDIHAAFDGDGSERRKIYPGYKAGRADHEEVDVCIKRARNMLTFSGIPTYVVDGWEADDVAATLVRKIGGQIIVVSSDQDLMQLASRRVGVTKISSSFYQREVWYDGSVLGHYGVEPYDLPQLKAFTGDKSDSISGATGIGPAKGIKLINEYGCIGAVYEAIDSGNHKGVLSAKRVRDILLRDKEDVLLALKLVSLKSDLPIEPMLCSYSKAKIHQAMVHYGFVSTFT